MVAFIRSITLIAVLGGGVLFGYWRLRESDHARAMAELTKLNEEMLERLAAREEMIARLSRSRRLGHLAITDQRIGTDGVVRESDILFIELDDQATELARQGFTVPGDVPYIDFLTVKFDAEQVAMGDPLRGRTLVLLRRIYSDRMKPSDGFLIDTPGAVPPGYAGSDIGQFEQQIWKHFWEIATDARTAEALGVRVAQGESVYKERVVVGQEFSLVVDAVGGVSLTPIPIPGDDVTAAESDSG